MNKLEMAIMHGMEQMDFDKVTAMLATTYWSPGIKKEEVLKGARNSAMVVGAFTNDKEQIGYARLVSDKTRFAYVMDVVVDKRFQKLGTGQAMVQYMMAHPEMKDVYQWILITKDAHGVYQKLGFKAIAHPDDWMEIRNARPER
jgi:N-acetylglutamate synthase-like GNAT family acetyltransferase